jgi:hypothetical protein
MRYLLIFLFLFSCTNVKEQEPVKYKLAVGATYKICGAKNNNPFEKQPKATVIITDIKQGYVQYCWDYEYDSPERQLFSRSEQEFVEQINQCNNAATNR